MSDAFNEALREVLGERIHTRFRLDDFCFKEQLAFILDKARFKTAVCSRRSGKTIACAADLMDTALKNPDRICVYITLSRSNAKRIIWPELLKINREYKLGGRPDNTELSLKIPNGSVIYCSGAKDASEIEKFRGLPITKCYIDECQSFRPYIRDLIDDVIAKALFDFNGTLCLIGTPGPVPSGYFHECSVKSNKWSHHAWTMMQNPHLKAKSGKDPFQMIIEDAERMGVPIEHPKIQRECFGRWIIDQDTLVFKYDHTKNHFTSIPVIANPWQYVVGVDLGHDDADAIAVLAWNEKSKELYLVHEVITKKQGITELANQILQVIATYDPHRIVMDTGGLGKKIAVEIQRRFAIPIIAAEKQRKFEFIELLNDALRTKKFFADSKSAFAEDCSLVEWDRDPEKPEKLKISERYHSDICDAVLYAYREALHWTYQEEVPKTKFQTPEWEKEQEEQRLKDLEDQYCKKDVDNSLMEVSTYGDESF